MNLPFFRFVPYAATAVALTLTTGCAGLLPKPPPQPAFYSLDWANSAARTAAAAANTQGSAPTLVVSPPRAAAGFDSQRIIYVREPHKLEYFAHSEWIDTPARMLTPLIVLAVESGGAFRAVLPTPSAAAADLRLDTEISRLQHDFAGQPSRVRFTLRANLVDNATRRVMASREFDESVAASSEDPYGGVVAANRAVQKVLEQLAGFCSETAGNWKPVEANGPKTR